MAHEETKEQEWHALKAEEVLKHLEVQNEGLSSAEVEKRLQHYGPNQLKEAPRPGFLALLWAQLNNFVVILLIVASVISALLGDYVEAAAIMAIVVLNSVLGIVQEQRAEQALGRLEETCRARCTGFARWRASFCACPITLCLATLFFLKRGILFPQTCVCSKR